MVQYSAALGRAERCALGRLGPCVRSRTRSMPQLRFSRSANDYNTPIQFHISVGRIEGGSTVVKALDAMLTGSPHVTLVKDQWFQWPTFRQLVRSMNLLMQPSFTESFNMVTADGAAESVPSVVSDAIDWAPSDWKAEMDNANDIARVAKVLLSTPNAGQEGFKALARHNEAGMREWKRWLGMPSC